MIDGNDDEVKQMKTLEGGITMFACVKGRERLRENVV